MLGTNDPGVLIGQLVPQSATSITAGTYDIGTKEVVNQSVNETLTGEATITSSGSLTGTGDSTSLVAIQLGGQSLSATLTVNADGTFSTSALSRGHHGRDHIRFPAHPGGRPEQCLSQHLVFNGGTDD